MARLWRWGWDLVVIIGGLTIALSFFGDQHPGFDSLAHFRAHLAVVTGLAALVRIWSGRGAGRWVAIAALALTVYAGTTTARFLIADPSIRTTAATTYTLLQLNAAGNPEGSSRLLLDLKPDFAALQEMPMLSEPRRREIEAVYPHIATCSNGRGWGDTVLLSQYAFAGEIVCGNARSFVRATVLLGDRALTLTSLHLSWPWPHGQHDDITANVDLLRQVSAPAVISGDFNATPWSLTVQRIGALTQTMPTSGIGPTWLLRGVEPGYRPYVGLPIDNILTSGVTIAQVQRLDDAGSDHLPVLMRFAFEDY